MRAGWRMVLVSLGCSALYWEGLVLGLHGA
jgi:hypothetical protein